MTEDDITASSGQYSTLTQTEYASPYQSSNSVQPAATSPAGSSTSSAAASSTASSAVAAAVAASNSSGSQATLSAQEIQAAVAKANANLASSNRVMDFRVDPATGLSIATIRNSQTGAVVQQIPGADIVALAKMLADWSPGKHMLLDLIA